MFLENVMFKRAGDREELEALIDFEVCKAMGACVIATDGGLPGPHIAGVLP
jgi:hypothetical protein